MSLPTVTSTATSLQAGTMACYEVCLSQATPVPSTVPLQSLQKPAGTGGCGEAPCRRRRFPSLAYVHMSSTTRSDAAIGCVGCSLNVNRCRYASIACRFLATSASVCLRSSSAMSSMLVHERSGYIYPAARAG